MRGEASIPAGALLGFLFVLARTAGIFVFVPLPGMGGNTALARTVLSLAATLALAPRWPSLDASGPVGLLALGMVAEASLGVTIGMVVAFLRESLLVGSQAIGLQAGFSYASMVNPSTEDESGVLLVLSDLTAGLLFFTMGLDRQVLGSLSLSLDRYPPGAFLLSRPVAEAIAGLGSVMLSIGLRLAFPVLALLLMVDLALALLGRLQPNLQLLTLAFPAKMLVALMLMAASAVLLPRLFESAAGLMFGVLRRVTGL